MAAVLWSALRGPLLAIKNGRSRESGASKQESHASMLPFVGWLLG